MRPAPSWQPTHPNRPAPRCARGWAVGLRVGALAGVVLALASGLAQAADPTPTRPAPEPAEAPGKTPGSGDPLVGRRLTEIGIAFQKEGDHMAAIAYFERALREVEHPKIRYFRAKSLHARGDLDEAYTEFKRIRADPRVAKYSVEIDAFLGAIKGERERRRLQRELAKERERREATRREALEPLP